VAAPNRPAIDLACTFHVPVIDPPWTRTRIPTSVITQLLFELRPCIFEVGRAYALPQVLYGLR
jgi:hypothetical protein